jgi:hypothetical protein
MNRIAAQFESYREKVIHREASETQVRETKLGFYAGAMAMMTIFGVIGTDQVSEDEGQQLLVDADQELRRFAESVEEGKA